jgi:hypothetical protein
MKLLRNPSVCLSMSGKYWETLNREVNLMSPEDNSENIG